METVLISGASGLIGKNLSKHLIINGYNVISLSRNLSQNTNVKTFFWNVEKNIIDVNAFRTIDYIIHLAGENIGDKRWSDKRKKVLLESRIHSTNLLLSEIKKQNIKLKAFISASAIGYYGSITSNKIFDENDSPSNDFLGTICQKWENAVDEFQKLGIRTVKIRTGVVFSKKGGALEKMIQPIKLGLVSALGTGKQYIPWIHIDDLCKIYAKAIEDDSINGVYNAVAPEHVNNVELTKVLAITLKKAYFLPNIPSFLIRLIFGQRATLLLKGSRVSSKKIISTGYQFNFPNINSALTDLFRL
ncbi:MAG: TIGR01777 family protein [Flavobacteriia bacterium]|nr:TIGR01777 family protein [Flavobacteriia bacterium]